MLNSGPAKKVSIYVREDQKYHGTSAYAAILDLLFFRGVSGATVINGVAGFGADRHLRTTRLVDLAQGLPIKVEFVETPEKVEELMPKLYEMVGTGLIEVQDTNVVKPPRKEIAPPIAAAPARKVEGKAKLMRIYLNEGDRWGDKPLYEALVEALRANDIAGVTVHTGIMGYGPKQRIYREGMTALSRQRPIMMAIIDSEDKLRRFVPLLDTMLRDGLVVMSDVDIVKYSHDYVEAERRQEARK